MNPFVDIEGNVFKRGKEVPEEKGTLPTSVLIKNDIQKYPPVVEDKVDVVDFDPDETPASLSPEDVDKAQEVNIPAEKPKKNASEEKEEVKELLDQNKDLLQRLNNLEAMIMRGNAGTNVIVREEKVKFGEHNGKDITPGDFVAEKKRYFMFGRGYVMSSYLTNQGKVEVSPYNVPVYFKKSFDDVRHIDGRNRVIPFCEYSTNSKKEMEFIENHPLYGIVIFVSHDAAVGATHSDNVTRLESIVNKFQTMSQKELFAKASLHNIDLHKDIYEIRNQLVWIEVNKEIESEKTQQALRRSDVAREKELFKTE